MAKHSSAPFQTPASSRERLVALTRPRVAAGVRSAPPGAVYRLQLRPGFGFAQAREILPLLHRIGITHLYASPIFKARAGSTHGYDVTDPTQLNPELGPEAEFEALARDLKRRGMALLLDIVPNHMAACSENAWWMDVLENGPASAFAHFFDIDWTPPSDIEGKLILPVLGGPYAAVLENQELRLGFDAGGFHVCYWEKRFPIDPKTYAEALGPESLAIPEMTEVVRAIKALPERASRGDEELARRREEKDAVKARLWELYCECAPVKELVRRRIARFQGEKGRLASFEPLDRLLRGQAYVLSFWRDSLERINYRRFFDISDLAGLRIDDPEVFETVHSLVFRLVKEGKAAGVRIDHIDGLRDPQRYLTRLRDRLAALRPGGSGEVYTVAEKILIGEETLREDWPVKGTTGYDFQNKVNGVFVDAANLQRMDEIYRRFTGSKAAYDEVVYEQKKRVMDALFPGELRRLAAWLHRMAAGDRAGCDIRPGAFIEALRETTACLPVYRTYVRSLSAGATDRAYIEKAIADAQARAGGACARALGFLRRVLLVDSDAIVGREQRPEWLRFAMSWQQFTGPVMAKGSEDTACYIYNRLVSLNVVGGDCKPVSPDEFHRFNEERIASWPLALNTTFTHDTKRSEDVRARINTLSELPGVWGRALLRWSRWNRPKKRTVCGAEAPDRNEEVLLYQALLGAWPLDSGEIPSFKERVKAFMIKAAREAKVNTSWIDCNAEHEAALCGFIEAILDDAAPNPFLDDFLRIQARIARCGAMQSLSQTVLKIFSPGVPDIYQGALLWDFSLVDPDNRRPVDFGARSETLARLEALDGDDTASLAEYLLETWRDGAVKLFVTTKALQYRRSHQELLAEGAYLPLRAAGPGAERAVCFARRSREEWAVVVAPRLTAQASNGRGFPVGSKVWGETSIELPARAPRRWRNVFTGEAIELSGGRGPARLPLAQALKRFPLAVLSGAV